MAAFIPGESPPEVRTAIVFMAAFLPAGDAVDGFDSLAEGLSLRSSSGARERQQSAMRHKAKSVPLLKQDGDMPRTENNGRFVFASRTVVLLSGRRIAAGCGGNTRGSTMKKLLLGFALALAGCGGQAKVVGSQQQAREPSFSCPLPPPNINPGLDPDVVPTLSSASPASIAMGGPDFTLTANGGGFTTESVLRWNGDDRTTQFVSGGQLRASILAGDIATPGLAQLTVFNPGPDGGESNVLNFPVFIRQTCNDLIYDPFSGLIFASVPSIVGGNAIVSIDPYTGEVSNSVFVGSEPGKLAVSDNGQSLFVALNGAAAVRQVDIPSMTAGLQFPLGSDPFFGPMYVEDMQVLPGYPDSIAVSRKYQGFSPRHAGVAVYDSGVRRPTQTPGHTGSNVIQFSASADTLYGYNNETTEFGFRRMRVDDSGVTILDSTGNLISGFGVDIRFDSGDWQIYSTTGRVIDPVERI